MYCILISPVSKLMSYELCGGGNELINYVAINDQIELHTS